MTPPLSRSSGPRRSEPSAEACGAGGAWVAAVAAALVALEDRRAADSVSDLWALEREARAAEVLRPDRERVERLIVQAVVQLPPAERELVLTRYRDRLGFEELARRHGLRRRAALTALTRSLEGIGREVRAGLGGSAVVYRAALVAAAEHVERSAPTRSRRRLAGAGALVVLAAVLGLRTLVAPRPTAAPSAEVAAVERREAPRAEFEAAPAADPTPPSAEAGEAALLETAREIQEFILRGRVTLVPAPVAERRVLGQVRVTAAGQGHELLALVDRQGGFSVAGLTPGTWRVTLRLPGYETLEREVVVTPGEGPPTLELEAHAATELEVSVVDRDGRGLFERAGLADDWSLTHGLSVWLGRTAPAEAEQPDGPSDRPWDRLGVFERLDPIDMARPAAIGRLRVERPRVVRWVALLYGDHVLDARPFGPGLEELAFEVDLERIDALRASVLLELHSRLGLDVAGAEVRLHGPNGEVRILRVGPDGTLRIEGLPPGRWWIEIVLPGHGRLTQALDLLPGSDVIVDELELAPPLHVSGTINFFGQSGVLSSDIRAVDLSTLDDPWTFQLQPTTDSVLQGGQAGAQFQQAFSFYDLDGGSSWVVVFEHPNAALSAMKVSSLVGELEFSAEYGSDVAFHWAPDVVGGDKLMLLVDANGLPLKVVAPNSDLAATVKLAPGQAYGLALWSNGAWGKLIDFTVPYEGLDLDVEW